MAAVRDALSIGLVTGMVLVLAIGTWCCVPGRRRAQESALRRHLSSLRSLIARYRGEVGRGPGSLDDLVRGGYLQRIPRDPVTGSRLSWIEVHSVTCSRASMVDVKSGAPGRSLDGSDYRVW